MWIILIILFPFIVAMGIILLFFWAVKKFNREHVDTEEDKKFYSVEHILTVEGQVANRQLEKFINGQEGSIKNVGKTTGRILKSWLKSFGGD